MKKLYSYVTENISFEIRWTEKTADIFCSTKDNEEPYLILKKDIEQMVFTARIKGVEKVNLYTNMAIEMHSTERPKDYGINKIKKLQLKNLQSLY
jgi:hypothetical protein